MDQASLYIGPRQRSGDQTGQFPASWHETLYVGFNKEGIFHNSHGSLKIQAVFVWLCDLTSVSD